MEDTDFARELFPDLANDTLHLNDIESVCFEALISVREHTDIPLSFYAAPNATFATLREHALRLAFSHLSATAPHASLSLTDLFARTFCRFFVGDVEHAVTDHLVLATPTDGPKPFRCLLSDPYDAAPSPGQESDYAASPHPHALLDTAKRRRVSTSPYPLLPPSPSLPVSPSMSSAPLPYPPLLPPLHPNAPYASSHFPLNPFPMPAASSAAHAGPSSLPSALSASFAPAAGSAPTSAAASPSASFIASSSASFPPYFPSAMPSTLSFASPVLRLSLLSGHNFGAIVRGRWTPKLRLAVTVTPPAVAMDENVRLRFFLAPQVTVVVGSEGCLRGLGKWEFGDGEVLKMTEYDVRVKEKEEGDGVWGVEVDVRVRASSKKKRYVTMVWVEAGGGGGGVASAPYYVLHSTKSMPGGGGKREREEE